MPPGTFCNFNINQIQQGNLKKDDYWQLRLAVQETVNAGLCKPELTNFELFPQTLWPNIHRASYHENALAHETWNCTDLETRLELKHNAVLNGLLHNPESFN